MRRAREEARHAVADCAVCRAVAKVARRTRDPPTLSTYLLLERFAGCPEAGRAYRRGGDDGTGEDALSSSSQSGGDEDTTDTPLTEALPLPVPASPLFHDTEAEAAAAEAAAVDAPATPPLVALPVAAAAPAWGALLTAWSDADTAALQARFTPHSNALNKLPSQARVHTDFTRTKHDYYIDGVLCHAGTGWYSPSGLMKKLWKPFDAQGVAMRLSRGKNPKYAGRPWQDICADWDANRDHGSAKHQAYDKWLQHEPLETADAEANPILPPPVGFYRAMASLADRFDVWQTEAELFDEDAKGYGVADLVLVERATGTLFIADFKNCKDEDLGATGHGDAHGTHPWSAAMPDTKLAHYRFQLSFYRRLLVGMLARDGAAQRVSDTMILLNFRPEEPEAFYRYDLAALDMAEFWAHLPWDAADPWHVRAPPDTPTLVPRPAADPPPPVADAALVTTRLVGPPQGPLPPDVVWTGKAYSKGAYQLPDSPWKAQEQWFGPPPPHVPAHYEQYLRGQRDLLMRLPLLVGKRLACWCRDPGHQCHADVLVRYAKACVCDPAFVAALAALAVDTADGNKDDAFAAWQAMGVTHPVLAAMRRLLQQQQAADDRPTNA